MTVFKNRQVKKKRSVPDFVSTVKILDCLYPPEEFKLMTVYGALGYGKSTYALKVVVDVLLHWFRNTIKGLEVDNPDRRDNAWELVKQLIVFHPKQFFEKLKAIRKIGVRIPALLWDDAGLWLYALEWNDPFIIRVGKYMNVARTWLASLLMTTPSPDYIFKKIRKFPQSFNLSIIKTTGNKRGMNAFRRQAKAYLQYYHIIKGYRIKGVVYRDNFTCLMPDKFYAWYKPLRDSYEELAFNLMMEEWDKIEDKSKVLAIGDYSDLSVPPITLTLPRN
jgi:hypothetical protein